MDQVERKLKDFESLAARIARLRAILGDQHSPPHLITRPKHHNRETFRRRIKKLQQLEVRQTRLLEEIVASTEPDIL